MKSNSMNDQLQAQISQIIAQIMVSVGEVKDFSMSQLPDIAQQYITYGVWKTGIISVILFIVIIAMFFVAKSGIEDLNRGDDIGMLKTIFPIPVGAISVIGLIENIHSFILVMTAPKVWFLLEIKNIIN